MKGYYIIPYSLEIGEVEIVRETPHFVFLEQGSRKWREKKAAGRRAYYRAEADAITALKDEAQRQVVIAARNLERIQREAEAIFAKYDGPNDVGAAP